MHSLRVNVKYTVVDPAALDDRNIYIRAYKYFDGDIADTSTYIKSTATSLIDHVTLR